MAEQQLVEIKIDIRDAVKKITDVEGKINEAKETAIALQKEENAITEKAQELAERGEKLSEEEAQHLENVKRKKEEALAVEKVYTKQKRALQKQIENEIRVREEGTTSLKAMRAELSSLRNTYDGLTKEQREGEAGKALAKQINDLNDALTKAEEATGRYQRNVGNYYGKMMEAIEDSMTVWKQWGTGGAQAFEGISKASVNAFEEMKAEAESTGESFNGFSGKLKSGGLQLKAVFKALTSGVGALGKSLLALAANPIVLAIAALVGVLIAAFKAIKKNEDLTNRLSVAFEKLKPVTDLVANALDAVAGVLVSLIEGFATLAGYIVDFVGELTGAGKVATEYAQIQKDHIALEKAERDAIISEAAAENKVAKLKHKVATEQKTDRAAAKKDLQEINKIEEEVAKQRVARAKEALRLAEADAAKSANDAEANKNLAELKAAVLKADTEYYQKTKENAAKIAEFDEKTRQEAEKLEKEKAEAAKKAQEEQAKRLKAAKEAAAKEAEAERKKWRDKINYEIAAIQKEKELRKKADEEFFKDLEERGKKELEVMKRNQRLRMAYEKRTAEDENAEQLLQAAQNKQTILASMASLAEERTALELRRRRGELASEAEYAQKVEALNAQMAEQNVAIIEWETEQELALKKAKEQAEADLLNATSQMLSTSLGQSKEGVILQKAITTAQVALSSAEAISKAVASASEGDPYTVALRIGAAVASVTSAIATAYDAISSCGFARGGYVSGGGSSTSDSVPARLSAGEAVMNARAVKYYSPLLSAINQSTGGAPIAQTAGASVMESDFLGRQLAGAVAGIRPQVAVRDFIGVQNRLNAVKISARLE